MGVQALAQQGVRTQEYVDISSSNNKAERDEWIARCSSYFVTPPKEIKSDIKCWYRRGIICQSNLLLTQA